MNLYLRYFDNETVVATVDEAMTFLGGLEIGDAQLEESLRQELVKYVAGPSTYPKRFKVRAHIYFVVIKTNVATLDEFKKNNKPRENVTAYGSSPIAASDNMPGWYDATLLFKRVVLVPNTGKSQYRDDHIRVVCYAVNPQDCYQQIVTYLRNSAEIDQRSQFPSSKGKNYQFTYLGPTCPESLADRAVLDDLPQPEVEAAPAASEPEAPADPAAEPQPAAE